MEKKDQSVYLKEISPHRRRVKYILFGVTILELIAVLIIPLTSFTIHKIALITTLTLAAIYQIIYWKILVTRVIKNAWGILLGTSPFTIFLSAAAYYSEGFLAATIIILLVTTIIVFNSTQLILLTVIEAAVINILFTIDIINGTANPPWIKNIILLNIGVLSTGLISAVTTFEVKEREARMVRLEEIDKIKTTFIALISHNLRTPITAIMGFLQMLDTQKPDNVMQDIKKNVKTLASLIESTVSISEFQTGKAYLKFAPIQVVLFVNDLISKKFQSIAQEKRIALKFIPPNVHHELLVIQADKKQLEIALTNIIDNAIKFTSHGEVRIELEEHNGVVLIKVIDTGIGIPEDFKQHLFSQFSRPGDILIYEQKGIGLGLYITKLIIEAHQGKIWFESQEDKGTTFFVSLPMKGGENK